LHRLIAFAEGEARTEKTVTSGNSEGRTLGIISSPDLTPNQFGMGSMNDIRLSRGSIVHGLGKRRGKRRFHVLAAW
jgi:hypothetical protein